MKFITIIFATLMSLAAESAPADASCDSKTMDNIKRLILPDISKNSEFVAYLFDGVKNGTFTCQMISEMKRAEGSLATCGYSYPRGVHKISIAGKNQSWILTVREDEVECSSGPGYWLLNFTTKLNSVTAMVHGEDTVYLQLANPRCARTENFQSIIYSYKDAASEKQVDRLGIFDGSDDQSCTEQKGDRIKQVPMEQLGLKFKELK